MNLRRFFGMMMSFLLLMSIAGAGAETPGDLSETGKMIVAQAQVLQSKMTVAFKILPAVLEDMFPPDIIEPSEPETEEIETETEPETEDLGTPLFPVETISYINASHEKKQMITDPFALRNDYDPEQFSIADGRMRYNGAGYVSAVGIDVSHHQGYINWQKVADAGIEFAIIRIGYRGYSDKGDIYPDRLFQKNLKEAKAAGLEVGVYFFAQAVNAEEAGEEAEYVLQLLDGVDLDLPVVYDPESVKTAAARTDNVPGEQFTVNCRVFCDCIRAAGYEPMIYANMSWEAEKLNMSALNDISFWFADYQNKPQSPYHYTYWQYTSHGSVPGINGRVDMNIRLTPEEEGLGT